MARDTEVLDDDESADSSPISGDSGSNNGLLHRRRYLKSIGAAAAAAASMTGVGAAAEDYDVIEVGAGQSRTVRLSDGETFENVLIDITANNARFHIRAIADNWEIRNVGFRGNWDSTVKSDAIICQVNSPNATGLIENVYFMGSENDDTYPGITGINVAKGHAGDVTIRNVNIQNCPDNSIYASNPGDPSNHPSGSGRGGRVVIEDSYARNSRAGGFRIGTDGSRVENCVMVGCDKGFWGYYEHTEVKDCDISGCRHADVRCGASQWSKGRRAEVTVTNTRFGSSQTPGAAIHGSSAGEPQRTRPEEVEGVPLSPEEAASGSSSSPGSPSLPDSSDEDDGDDEPEGDLLAFVTDPEARYAEYEFAADGPVEPAEADYESPSGGSIGANGNDSVEESDGTYSVSGLTGGGYGDAFRVDGAVTSIDIDQPEVMWVELNGERLSVEEVIEETGGETDEDEQVSDHLLAFVTEPEARYAEYEFAAAGPVELADADYESPSGASIGGNGNDTIEESDGTYSVSGLTGGGYGDAFRVSGPVTSIDIDQPDVMWVELDGEKMSVEEVIEETSRDGSEDGSEEDESEEDRPSNAIVIDGTRSDGSAAYSFRVTGAVEKATHQDASIDDGDSVDGTEVEGSVDGSKDAYWFSGNIDDFWLNGDALVDVEYDAR